LGNFLTQRRKEEKRQKRKEKEEEEKEKLVAPHLTACHYPKLSRFAIIAFRPERAKDNSQGWSKA
jgi:hypothetical protein